MTHSLLDISLPLLCLISSLQRGAEMEWEGASVNTPQYWFLPGNVKTSQPDLALGKPM